MTDCRFPYPQDEGCSPNILRKSPGTGQRVGTDCNYKVMSISWKYLCTFSMYCCYVEDTKNRSQGHLLAYKVFIPTRKLQNLGNDEWKWMMSSILQDVFMFVLNQNKNLLGH